MWFSQAAFSICVVEGPSIRAWKTVLAFSHFGHCFNQSLRNVHLPSGLQSLTFGSWYDISLEQVTLTSGLQHLIWGDDYDQSLENVAFPNGLLTLTFGRASNQTLTKVALPTDLQSLTVGHPFDQSVDGLSWPPSLRHVIFGYVFDHSLDNAVLPSSLQIWPTLPLELRQCAVAFWSSHFNSGLFRCPGIAIRPSHVDARRSVQPELGQHDSAKQPPQIDTWP